MSIRINRRYGKNHYYFWQKPVNVYVTHRHLYYRKKKSDEPQFLVSTDLHYVLISEKTSFQNLRLIKFWTSVTAKPTSNKANKSCRVCQMAIVVVADSR